MSGHTPGPWYWDFDRDDMASLRSEGDNEPVMIDIACYPGLEDRCLIAAAPDLYDVAESAIFRLESFIDGEMEMPMASMEVLLEALKRAIARAKGEA